MGHLINCCNNGHKASDRWRNVSSPWNTKGTSKDQKGKGNQAGSLDDAVQPQEAEAETGSPELEAFDASQSRVVRLAEPLEQSISERQTYKEFG